MDLEKELRAYKDPRESEGKGSKKRKRLTFDEVSNIVLEGTGDGKPIKTGRDLEAAAKRLKRPGGGAHKTQQKQTGGIGKGNVCCGRKIIFTSLRALCPGPSLGASVAQTHDVEPLLELH